MSGCDLGAVEAYALGELGGEAAGRLRAHLGACAACSRELALLRAERRALSSFARGEPRPLPAFEAVLARSLAGEGRGAAAAAGARPARPGGRRGAWLGRLRALGERAVEGAPRPPPAWVGLGAFAAAAAIVLQFLPAASSPAPFLSDEPGGLACRVEEPARFEVAVASAEDAFRACLMVTPTYAPPALVEGDAADGSFD
ncbi:MAG TPA: zf-HC2 domain-containing protein [Polyangiaceae bacterium]|nr:zf-HC2 domain-containing protein [Polyangiaceae bacterium]